MTQPISKGRWTLPYTQSAPVESGPAQQSDGMLATDLTEQLRDYSNRAEKLETVGRRIIEVAVDLQQDFLRLEQQLKTPSTGARRKRKREDSNTSTAQVAPQVSGGRAISGESMLKKVKQWSALAYTSACEERGNTLFLCDLEVGALDPSARSRDLVVQSIDKDSFHVQAAYFNPSTVMQEWRTLALHYKLNQLPITFSIWGHSFVNPDSANWLSENFAVTLVNSIQKCFEKNSFDEALIQGLSLGFSQAASRLKEMRGFCTVTCVMLINDRVLVADSGGLTKTFLYVPEDQAQLYTEDGPFQVVPLNTEQKMITSQVINGQQVQIPTKGLGAINGSPIQGMSPEPKITMARLHPGSSVVMVDRDAFSDISIRNIGTGLSRLREKKLSYCQAKLLVQTASRTNQKQGSATVITKYKA